MFTPNTGLNFTLVNKKWLSANTLIHNICLRTLLSRHTWDNSESFALQRGTQNFGIFDNLFLIHFELWTCSFFKSNTDSCKQQNVNECDCILLMLCHVMLREDHSTVNTVLFFSTSYTWIQNSNNTLLVASLQGRPKATQNASFLRGTKIRK